SLRGRFQFSTEKAYRVRTCRPRRAEVSTTSRTEAMPARWPSTRRLCRSFAQRPLPSMMIATWRGSRSKSMALTRACSSEPDGTTSSRSWSDIAEILMLTPGHGGEPASNERRERVRAAREAGFTPAQRAGGFGGRDHSAPQLNDAASTRDSVRVAHAHERQPARGRRRRPARAVPGLEGAAQVVDRRLPAAGGDEPAD